MKQKLIPFLISIFLVLFLVARFMSLKADPPKDHMNYGQTLLTDPYHLTFASRNAVLFDDWNPRDYHRWDVFEKSLISGVSYLSFQAFGVSRTTANTAALFLSTGGILLFLLGFLGLRRLPEIAITAAVLLLNSMLFVYGRLPFLETGLIFLSGLLFCLFMNFHDRWWGQVLAGLLVAVAALAGKLFGFLLIGPVVVSLIYRFRAKATVPLLITGVGVLSGAAAIVLLLYAGDMSTAIQYYQEHTTGMYPDPPGLASLTGFFKMLVTYGSESGLWDFTPVQLVFTTLGTVLALLYLAPRDRYRAEDLPLLFCLIWFWAGIAGLSPFYYRPARYAIFLLLPSAALVGFFVYWAKERQLSFRIRDRLVTAPLLFLVLCYFLVQLRSIFIYDGQKMPTLVAFLPLAIILAAITTIALYLLLRRRSTTMLAPWISFSVTSLYLALIVLQSLHIWHTVITPQSNLVQFNRELSALVSKDAVLTGPFMPALTIDNSLQGVIYGFGMSKIDSGVFSRLCVTHVLANRDNWDVAVKEFPELSSIQSLVDFPINDQVIGLYRLPKAGVKMTDFERGAKYLLDRQPDSALLVLGRFSTAHPNSIVGITHFAWALVLNGRLVDADKLLHSIADKHPGSYLLHIRCQYIYERMYLLTQNIEFLNSARAHADRTAELGLPGESIL